MRVREPQSTTNRSEADVVLSRARRDATELAAEDVGRIIIGDTTDSSVRIWVQGSRRYPRVRLLVRPVGQPRADPVPEQEGLVLEQHDYTACFDFCRLNAATTYEVAASFTHRMAGYLPWLSSRRVTGVFRTFPRGDEAKPEPFSFLLGSCNLPVVAINNRAAQALQVVGFNLAERSLERPLPDRWPQLTPGESWWLLAARWLMALRGVRCLLGFLIRYSLMAVFLGTGGKWSKQPMLRSPFLKLAGMFAGHRIEFCKGQRAPHAGQTLIGRNSRESGVVAFEPVVESGSWDYHDAQGYMILTDTRGGFQPGECLRAKRDRGAKEEISQGENIAQVRAISSFEPEGLPKPAFMIHAGDQIYYDFPKWNREPRLDSYRETYREAWFEDRFERFFLARGSHYMTMDDHEIVDEFATDLELPQNRRKAPKSATGSSQLPEPKRFQAKRYLEAAGPAYHEYVHSRHPDGPLYYDFRHGAARFFVMDTRTCRNRDHDSQMIGKDQMCAFRRWLTSDPQDLKFVVSSVPFVAEVMRSDSLLTASLRNEEKSLLKRTAELAQTHGPSHRGVIELRARVAGIRDKIRLEEARIRGNDKWCGPSFRWQRDEIIEFIEDQKIERVVFLVGDMHCAYHASMSIGEGHRWERRTIHELAGGPINQLEFARREQFAPVVSLTTRVGRVPYQIRLHQFHGNASAVMHIQVNNVPDPREPCAQVPEIVWRVIRTMTDPEAVPDPEVQRDAEKKASRAKDRQPNSKRPMRIKDHPPISGRITLGRRWAVEQLPTW
jgi:hypothetical protein